MTLPSRCTVQMPVPLLFRPSMPNCGGIGVSKKSYRTSRYLNFSVSYVPSATTRIRIGTMRIPQPATLCSVASIDIPDSKDVITATTSSVVSHSNPPCPTVDSARTLSLDSPQALLTIISAMINTSKAMMYRNSLRQSVTASVVCLTTHLSRAPLPMLLTPRFRWHEQQGRQCHYQ